MKVLYHLIFIFISFYSFSQNGIPPQYLTAQPFPDSVENLVLENSSGDELTFGQLLKKHEGKKVVIDLWATWCRDCIEGLPKLNKLIKKAKKKDVDFVFISVDEKVGQWKIGIKKLKMPGFHYRIPKGWKNTFTNYIELDWIPRYLVLDEHGQIIMPKAISAGENSIQNTVLE